LVTSFLEANNSAEIMESEYLNQIWTDSEIMKSFEGKNWKEMHRRVRSQLTPEEFKLEYIRMKLNLPHRQFAK
jgi:hypothetical protein